MFSTGCDITVATDGTASVSRLPQMRLKNALNSRDILAAHDHWQSAERAQHLPIMSKIIMTLTLTAENEDEGATAPAYRACAY